MTSLQFVIWNITPFKVLIWSRVSSRFLLWSTISHLSCRLEVSNPSSSWFEISHLPNFMWFEVSHPPCSWWIWDIFWPEIRIMYSKYMVWGIMYLYFLQVSGLRYHVLVRPPNFWFEVVCTYLYILPISGLRYHVRNCTSPNFWFGV